ncbi:hypothetical protein [Enemella sp. A6]|uniref:hypothetical protein n=1 Tax=Enemella sp. A6 TaxID=3440152 RepID=UPI003EBF5E66
MSRTEGERFACEKCGSELEYTKACPCGTEDGGRHEEICCGQQMKKVQQKVNQ